MPARPGETRIVIMQVHTTEDEDRLGLAVEAWNGANPDAPITVEHYSSTVIRTPKEAS